MAITPDRIPNQTAVDVPIVPDSTAQPRHRTTHVSHEPGGSAAAISLVVATDTTATE
jgi:hypothetical protein